MDYPEKWFQNCGTGPLGGTQSPYTGVWQQPIHFYAVSTTTTSPFTSNVLGLRQKSQKGDWVSQNQVK